MNEVMRNRQLVRLAGCLVGMAAMVLQSCMEANATAMTANRCPVVSLPQYRCIRMSACFHGYFLLLIGRHSLNPCFP